MKLVFNSRLFRLPYLKKFEAITLPFAIFFKHSREQTDPVTIHHEEIHMEQRARIGTFRFYVQYLWEYARNIIKYRNLMTAYYEISFEKEAYERQQEL